MMQNQTNMVGIHHKYLLHFSLYFLALLMLVLQDQWDLMLEKLMGLQKGFFQ
jgi:hypothetical protein